MGKIRNPYKILVWMLEVNMELRRLRSMWDDIIKMDLTEVEWVEFISLGI